MNCAQVKEQLVDFLYEELPPNPRAAFVEHLHGCPGCSAEVASHQKALGQARAALAGPLLQEPPARVHAAVLAAANEAAATTKRDAQRQGERAPRVGAGGLRPPEPERGRVWEPSQGSHDKDDEPGFFARFWRTPWLLPAFGAVSVATAVFLVKVLKNPEGLPGQKPRPVDELAVPAAARPTVAPVPAEQAGPAPALGAAAPADKPPLEGITRRQPPERAKARSRTAKTAGKTEARVELGGGAPTSGASTRFAEPPPPRPAAKASRDIDDMLGSVGRRPVPAPVANEAAKPAAEKKTRAARDGDTPLWNASPASAPPRPPAPAAAPAAPPSPSQVMRSKRAETEAEEAPMAATGDRGYDAKETAKDKGAPSLDESIKKADRLFVAQNWTAAAEAYRDLLRRFPSHKDAPKWRDRISQSLFAEENRRGKGAKGSEAAKSSGGSEVLNGRK